jgi:hypothetical protein
MTAGGSEAAAMLAAVGRLNQDGRTPVTGRQAATEAGLGISDAELDELVRALLNAAPRLLELA